MPLPTGLRRDSGGIFHLRIGVPDDVRPHWPLQRNGRPAVDAFRKSLRTRERAEAIAQTHALLAEYHAQFASVRDLNRPRLTQLSPKLVAYLEGQIKHELLDGDDVRGVIGVALEGVPWNLRAEFGDEWKDAELLEIWSRSLKQQHAEGNYVITQGFVDMLLSNIGLPKADWTQQAGALARLGRALAMAYESIAKRAIGELIDTPPAPEPYAPEAPAQPEPPKAPALTLRDALPHWIQLTKARPNAIQRTERALTLWEAAVGMVPLNDITRATGGEFVLYLLDDDREFGRKTAKNQADAINSLVNKAVQQGLMPLNPLIMKFDIEDSQKRTPWTKEQLKTLHTEPITGEQSDEVDPVDADLLISMLLWSGARIGEIAGLRVQDIQEREGSARPGKRSRLALSKPCTFGNVLNIRGWPAHVPASGRQDR